MIYIRTILFNSHNIIYNGYRHSSIKGTYDTDCDRHIGKYFNGDEVFTVNVSHGFDTFYAVVRDQPTAFSEQAVFRTNDYSNRILHINSVIME